MLGTVLEGAWSIIIRFKLELRVKFSIFCYLFVYFKDHTEDLEKLLESDADLSEDFDGVGPTDLEEGQPQNSLGDADLSAGTVGSTDLEEGRQQNSLAEAGDVVGSTDLEGHQVSMAEQSLLHAEMRSFSISSLADTESPNANSTVREAVR